MSDGYMSFEDAVLLMRTQQEHSALLSDAYLDGDLLGGARRFLESGEFQRLKEIVESRLAGASVVDLGAGTGVATFAFVQSGAARVVAVEPDPSNEVGRGAIARFTDNLPVEIIDAYAEDLPLADSTADIVYARQVLHHTKDLPAAVRECARVLKPGGLFVAAREHVVESDQAMAEFLAAHPIHQLTGSEGAYSRHQYEQAIVDSGLRLLDSLGPLDSVMNAFPAVCSQDELKTVAATALEKRFGLIGKLAAHLSPIRARYFARMKSSAEAAPGCIWTFIAEKPNS